MRAPHGANAQVRKQKKPKGTSPLTAWWARSVASCRLGHDTETELHSAQSNIGFCPQHNILFPNLTVAEHLWFFCKVKHVSDKHVFRYIDEMIADLQLLDKRHAKASTLSGGMKRKLSCGLALVGKAPVVILDEPTSGCDPSARRAIWDLLLKNKKGRTMLLSTHFMDEADVLSDRIAIMVHGQIECAGSPLALKAHYGIGTHLNIVKRIDCDSKEVMDHIHGHIATVSIFSLPRPCVLALNPSLPPSLPTPLPLTPAAPLRAEHAVLPHIGKGRTLLVDCFAISCLPRQITQLER